MSQMNNAKKVRFAPSPTGFLHIGSARTALFNWVFAKKYHAAYLLRIEDTDVNRSKREYLEEILDSLRWLGIVWDEEVYQSQRLEIYREHAQKLVASGKAYQEDGAVIFRYETGSVEFEDLVRGSIVYNELPKDREVIIKSDGSATYNFACCVDDALLGITHVIRGEDHIPNTPKQILISHALGLPVPKFAHLPMILSSGGGKLSKRWGATSLREYKEQGYLASAIRNYLLLLGWSPGNNAEMLSMEQAVALFKIKDINKTGAMFSLDKLRWLNAEYIKQFTAQEFTKVVSEYLRHMNKYPGCEENYFARVAALYQSRTTTLYEFFERTVAWFNDEFPYADDTEDILQKPLIKEIETLRDHLAVLENFSSYNIEHTFRMVGEQLGVKLKVLVHPVRVALTGSRVGPSLFETVEVLGKEKVIHRLRRLLEFWKKGNRE